MKKRWKKIFFLTVFLFSFTTAQTNLNFQQRIARNAYSNAINNSRIGKDTIKILALMVEFKKDNDDRTTGNGTFDTSYAPNQIDPPPHNSQYFKNKLLFVKNYFRKVSNGILTIESDLIDSIITLPNSMLDYSPPIHITDNTKMVQLIRDGWHLADSLHPEIDFSSYDLFVVFHAGVGRDIDLVSILGYNPTPYDIPSLYIDSITISQHGYEKGIPVEGNSFFIKNSIVLPETESRYIKTGAGDLDLQYSINGLFATCIGNFLGLPDLFNTKTGRSGIGSFGLMDGASMFAYNGIFPPEPSAWEKIYLGWVEPIVILSSTESLTVPAVSLSNSQQDTIYKIPISSTEYFLVENRSRNPYGRGLDIEIIDANGNPQLKHFDLDVEGFNYYDAKAIKGSVVDVSNFDWAMGDQNGYVGSCEGGGILIWHIDENIITNGIKTNTVNANPEHRGVDLEEADGSQDIGESYDFLTPGAGTEYGNPYDFWFKENPVPSYKNVFSNNSLPNSRSYSGSASLITLKNFSSKSSRMTFTVEIGNQQLLTRDSVLYRKAGKANCYPTSTAEHIYFSTYEGTFAIKNDGSSLTNNPTGLLSNLNSFSGIAVYKRADFELVSLSKDNMLALFRFTAGTNNIDSMKSVFWKHFTTNPCFMDSSTIIIGTERGLFAFDVDNYLTKKDSVVTDTVYSITSLPNSYYFVTSKIIYSKNSYIELPLTSQHWALVSAASPSGNYICAIEKGGSKLICYNEQLDKKIFDVTLSGSPIVEAAIADLDGDGEKDIIIQTKKSLYVFNRIGAILDGFPVQSNKHSEFTGTPLIADYNNDGKLEVIVFANNGTIWIYNNKGKLLSGFPIQVCSAGEIFPALYKSNSGKLGIAVFSENDSLNVFANSFTANLNSFKWWQYLGNERLTNSETSTTSVILPTEEYFPKSRVYNWPNPVYGDKTHIRFYTSEDAEVIVTILDIAGVKITELKGRGYKGMDNEIPWIVSNIKSGVYLARVEARSSTKTDVAFIKIAVIK